MNTLGQTSSKSEAQAINKSVTDLAFYDGHGTRQLLQVHEDSTRERLICPTTIGVSGLSYVVQNIVTNKV